MGRPPTTLLQCREVHALLLARGVAPGQRIPRDLWNQLIVQGCEVSSAQARVITRTGVEAGLWGVDLPKAQGGRFGLTPGAVFLISTGEAAATAVVA